MTVTAARLEPAAPSPDWEGAAVAGSSPLTLQTASAPWGYSLQFRVPRRSASKNPGGGQYWARFDLEVVRGTIGISIYAPSEQLIGEQFFRQNAGRITALIPIPPELAPDVPLMVRSGGEASSAARIYSADLLRDPDRSTGTVAPIDVGP